VTTIVHCNAATKTYGQDEVEVHAVQAVTVEVTKGEFVSLSGPSGSGKTTLLNLIGGLDRPTSGEITVDGSRVDQMKKADLAELRLHKIGFVFQAYNLIPVLSALENIEFIMQLQGISPDIRRKQALSILNEVGLEGLGDRRPAELSGGQQQRVAVARAIVSEPAIILADEPTANLDSATAEELLNLMESLNRNKQITFIVATHDQRVIDLTRRRIRMVDGRIDTDVTEAD
jgi:putative ABC transport system ATP-binding protein|tara:strand:- start:251 stop:943 length:693 start_codon:yes stop_codon:yes gene_type:complete